MLQFIPALGDMIVQCLEWTYIIFDKTGMLPFYFSVIVIFLVISYLLSSVLVSSRGSDKVRRRKDGDNDG